MFIGDTYMVDKTCNFCPLLLWVFVGLCDNGKSDISISAIIFYKL